MRRFVLVLGAALSSIVGCDGGSGSGDPPPAYSIRDALQGIWSTCAVDALQSRSERITIGFSGTHMVDSGRHYPNAACAAPSDAEHGTLASVVLGDAVTADFAGLSVTAYELDSTTEYGKVEYSIVFVSPAGDHLYVGDTRTANDGSTPELRPTSLITRFYFDKLPDSGAAAGLPAIQGVWSVCNPHGPALAYRDTYLVSGSHTVTAINGYPNLGCDGPEYTAAEGGLGSISIGSPVTASLDGTDVTAYPWDDTDEEGVARYSLAFIEENPTADRLYSGDTDSTNNGSTPELRPTTLRTWYLQRQ